MRERGSVRLAAMLTTSILLGGLTRSAEAGLVRGHYVTTAFATALERTHSVVGAIAATTSAGIPQLGAYMTCWGEAPDCLSFTQDMHIRSGSCPYPLGAPRPQPYVGPRERDLCEGPVKAMKEADPAHFLLPLPDAAHATRFRWIVNIQRYAILHTVGGTWKDEKDRRWTFSPEFDAVIPGVADPAPFSVELDVAGRAADELHFESSAVKAENIPGGAYTPGVTAVVVGFTRNGDTLTLYPASFAKGSEVPTIDRAHPAAVLHRVAPPDDPVEAARVP